VLVNFEWSFLGLLKYTGDSLTGESVAFRNAMVFLSQLGLLSAGLTGNYLTGVIVAPMTVVWQIGSLFEYSGAYRQLCL
jgi:hypothetical protein